MERSEKALRQYRIILSADTASEVRQPPERCLSRKAGIVRCCLKKNAALLRFLAFLLLDLIFGVPRGE